MAAPPTPPLVLTAPLTYPPDLSDAMPSAGYLLPLFPPSWFTGSVIAPQVFGTLDRAFERARVATDALYASHVLDQAEGSALDDVVALLGITRLPLEEDPDLRGRTKATALHGLSACTAPAMITYLQAVFGLVCSATNGASGTATASIFFQGYSPLLVNAPTLVRQKQAYGVTITCYVALPTDSSTLCGDFLAGEEPLGGTAALILLG